MELMNSGKQTDTPRTDAAKSYWDSAERENCVSIVLARELELEAVTYKNEALSLRDSHDLLYRDYQKLEAEVERLKEMVMEAARKGDELLEPFRLRAEKAETLIKQIHAFVSALNPTNK
jgi:phage shock protein A